MVAGPKTVTELSLVRENAGADAKLIAAAPDLLAAVKEFVAWCEDNDVECIALDEAKDAIKKAKGE